MSEQWRARIRQEFDAEAPYYESNRLAPWYQAHAEHLLVHLAPEPGDVVLDVGCATGHLLRRVARSRPGIVGIGLDLAPRMIEVARIRARAERLDGLTFVTADWEDPGLEIDAILGGRRATHVVCASALHYFAAPGEALRRLHDALRPGGTLLVLERAMDHSRLTRLWDLAHRFLIRDPVRFTGEEDLARLARSAGFEDAAVVARLSRLWWKGKFYTRLALLRGTRPADADAT